MEWASAATIIKTYDVSRSTLRRWSSTSITGHRISSTGTRRLYSVHDVRRQLGFDVKQTPQEVIGYCRVSSPKQKTSGDMCRQVEALQQQYPSISRIIQDVGSGLNYKRKGLRSLLELIYKGMVKEVVVLHKDRLARYGVELLEYIFTKSGTKLVVLDDSDSTATFELGEDLMAVVTFFVAQYNGRRAAKHRRQRREYHENS